MEGGKGLGNAIADFKMAFTALLQVRGVRGGVPHKFVTSLWRVFLLALHLSEGFL